MFGANSPRKIRPPLLLVIPAIFLSATVDAMDLCWSHDNERDCLDQGLFQGNSTFQPTIGCRWDESNACIGTKSPIRNVAATFKTKETYYCDGCLGDPNNPDKGTFPEVYVELSWDQNFLEYSDQNFLEYSPPEFELIEHKIILYRGNEELYKDEEYRVKIFEQDLMTYFLKEKSINKFPLKDKFSVFIHESEVGAADNNEFRGNSLYDLTLFNNKINLIEITANFKLEGHDELLESSYFVRMPSLFASAFQPTYADPDFSDNPMPPHMLCEEDYESTMSALPGHCSSCHDVVALQCKTYDQFKLSDLSVCDVRDVCGVDEYWFRCACVKCGPGTFSRDGVACRACPAHSYLLTPAQRVLGLGPCSFCGLPPGDSDYFGEGGERRRSLLQILTPTSAPTPSTSLPTPAPTSESTSAPTKNVRPLLRRQLGAPLGNPPTASQIDPETPSSESCRAGSSADLPDELLGMVAGAPVSASNDFVFVRGQSPDEEEELFFASFLGIALVSVVALVLFPMCNRRCGRCCDSNLTHLDSAHMVFEEFGLMEEFNRSSYKREAKPHRGLIILLGYLISALMIGILLYQFITGRYEEDRRIIADINCDQVTPVEVSWLLAGTNEDLDCSNDFAFSVQLASRNNRGQAALWPNSNLVDCDEPDMADPEFAEHPFREYCALDHRHCLRLRARLGEMEVAAFDPNSRASLPSLPRRLATSQPEAEPEIGPFDRLAPVPDDQTRPDPETYPLLTGDTVSLLVNSTFLRPVFAAGVAVSVTARSLKDTPCDASSCRGNRKQNRLVHISVPDAEHTINGDAGHTEIELLPAIHLDQNEEQISSGFYPRVRSSANERFLQTAGSEYMYGGVTLQPWVKLSLQVGCPSFTLQVWEKEAITLTALATSLLAIPPAFIVLFAMLNNLHECVRRKMLKTKSSEASPSVELSAAPGADLDDTLVSAAVPAASEKPAKPPRNPDASGSKQVTSSSNV